MTLTSPLGSCCWRVRNGNQIFHMVKKARSRRMRQWPYLMNNSLIIALGGFTTHTRRTYILFCRDSFEYAELEEHPFLCNHLGKQVKLRLTKTGCRGKKAHNKTVSSSTVFCLLPAATKRIGQGKVWVLFHGKKTCRLSLGYYLWYLCHIELR